MNVLRRHRTKAKPIVYAFIDSQNLNLGIQKAGWKMDWRAFRAYLNDTYGVTKAFMFIGYMPENEPLYEYMHELGYLIVLKQTVDLAPTDKDDEDRKSIVKGNIDADLVLYAMKELSNYNKAIIVSGDGDFASLIEYLHDRHKLLKVLAPNRQYSSLLKNWENYIVRLDLLRSKLAYRDRARRVTKR